MLPITDPWFYAAAIPAVFLVGLSKGGFGGTMAMLGVPIMTLAISPVQAAGIMLPILVMMDIIALIAYKGQADWKTIAILLPAAVVGIGVGWAAAAYVNDDFVILLVGLISIAFVIDYVFKRRKQARRRQSQCSERDILGNGDGFHQLHQPYRWPALPDVHAAPAHGAGLVCRHGRDLLRGRQRTQAHSLFHARGSSTRPT